MTITILFHSLFIPHAAAMDKPVPAQVVPVMEDVPAGNFKMGARSDGDDKQWRQRYHDDPMRELPVHTVTLDAYKIGKYEITNSQFAAVLNWALEKGYLKDGGGARYSGGAIYVDEGDRQFVFHPDSTASQLAYSGGKFSCTTRDGYSMDDHPVSLVSWYGSVAFCNWLSEMLDLTPCYDLSTWKIIKPFPNGYRLPTEAEWERAAAWDPERPTEPVDLRHWIYAFKSDTLENRNRANYHDNVNPLGLKKSPRTSPVGFFNGINEETMDSPSPVGCYDMCGNVREWCHDLYGGDYYATGGPPWKNPTGPTAVHNLRILRGGGYRGYGVADKRTASRFGYSPDKAIEDLGFRVARTSYGVEVEGERPEQPTVLPQVPVPAMTELHNPGERQIFAGIEFVWIPPGTFTMGSETADRDERPPHRVTLSRGFWLGKYEMTKGQWKSVMETEPWKGRSRVFDDDDSPAVYVTWEDAQKLVEKLNAENDGGFRLPTEAEWERACRAGTDTAYYFGDDPGKPSFLGIGNGDVLGEHAWYSKNIWREYARVVGQKKPNAWGLHDMHGNVWELCQDKYRRDYYANSRELDPKGPKLGDGCAVRGGDFLSHARHCQSASRTGIGTQSPGSDVGIRLARYDEQMREFIRRQAAQQVGEPGSEADAVRADSIQEWPAQPSPEEARNKLAEMRVAPTGRNVVKYAGGGQLDTVNLLLAARADIDTIAHTGRKPGGMTALLFALQEDEREMVRFLIERGADVNLADTNGLTPIAAAAGKGDLEIFTILLAEGADPRIPDRNGRTPFVAAVENGNVNIINALLAEGLDANYADPKGNTLLHTAIKAGNTDAFKVLLERGADPHAANMDGRTSLYYAAVFKADAEVFEALLAAGADPNALDEGGRTILDIVVMVGRAEGVREVLIAHGATRPVRKPLFELWMLIFILALLPLPYHLVHSIQYQYCKREEDDGIFYFEIRWKGDILRRQIQVIPGSPPIRETLAQPSTLKETAGLIPCSAREFYRHWRHRNIAQLIFNLHLRLCVLAVLFSTFALVVTAEEQARRYGRFSPLFALEEFLEDFFYAGDWLIGVIIGGPLVTGALQLLVLVIFQFVRPPLRNRVTAIIIGVVAGLISIGCGLYYVGLATAGL